MSLVQKLGINPDYKEFMDEHLNAQIVLLQNNIKTEFFPSPDKLFKFLISNPKVIIVGQDPYSTGNATGTGFAVDKNVDIPPSLSVIIQTLEKLNGETIDNFDRTLGYWEEQGVMIMNSALSVQKNSPSTHAFLWKAFITKLITYIEEKYSPIWVFLGVHANTFSDLVAEKYVDNHPMVNVYSSSTHTFKGEFFKEIQNKLNISWYEK